jgi:hypothetical protein
MPLANPARVITSLAGENHQSGPYSIPEALPHDIAESGIIAAMKSAILRADEGYDILHNGVWRTFRDTRDAAFEAARFAKSRARDELIEVVNRSTGAKSIMLEDGRAG